MATAALRRLLGMPQLPPGALATALAANEAQLREIREGLDQLEKEFDAVVAQDREDGVFVEPFGHNDDDSSEGASVHVDLTRAKGYREMPVNETLHRIRLPPELSNFGNEAPDCGGETEKNAAKSAAREDFEGRNEVLLWEERVVGDHEVPRQSRHH